MEENNGAVEQGKKPGKLKKILIPVVAVVVVVAVVLAVLVFTGKLDFNFSKKDKALAGYDKMAEVVTGVATDLQTEVEEAGLNTKLSLNNLKEIDASLDLSVDVKKLEISELSSDNEDILQAIIDLLADTKLSINAKSNGEKLYANVGVSSGNLALSAEANYDGELIGVRSKELNEKWIAVDAGKVTDALSEEIDLDATKEEIEKMAQEIADVASELAFTDEEVEHFKSTYAGIPKEFLESLDVESEKATVEINDKEKNCTKATIKLDDEDVKDLLITYVETVGEDDKGIEILNKRFKAIAEYAEEIYTTMDAVSEYEDDYYDDYYDNDYYDDYYYDDYYYDDYDYEPDFSSMDLTELVNAETIDALVEEIEALDLEGLEISIDTYATLTKVYRTDIIVEIDGTKLVLECTFEDGTTVIDIAVKASGMSVDIATLKIVNEKNHKALEFALAKDMVAYAGTDMSLAIDCTIEENKMKTSVELDMGSEGNVAFISEITVKENTESAYTANAKTTLKAKVEEVIDCDVTVNTNTSIKTSNVSFDKVGEYVDVTDYLLTEEMSEELTTELQEYVLDAVPNVTKLLEGLKNIDFVDEYFATEIDDLIDELESLESL